MSNILRRARRRSAHTVEWSGLTSNRHSVVFIIFDVVVVVVAAADAPAREDAGTDVVSLVLPSLSLSPPRSPLH